MFTLREKSNAIALIVAVIIGWLHTAEAVASPYATAWIDGHNSRSRLIVGGAPSANGAMQRYVGFEIAMKPGWKTYWRQPGTAGGIPPQLSWQGSQNLKSAKLYFPAPKRLIDASGETIGYKNAVVLPISIEPEDPAKPIQLKMQAFFGVCGETCIPAQASFAVTLSPALFRQTPPELAKALRHLPEMGAGQTNASGARGDGSAPTLVAARTVSAGAGRQALQFDVRFPGGIAGADLFAETGDHMTLAMSKVVGRPAAGMIRYQIGIEDAAQWKSLAKHGVIVTMVSSAGAREQRIQRP